MAPTVSKGNELYTGIIANMRPGANDPVSPTAQTMLSKAGLVKRLMFFKEVPLFADVTDAELMALVQDFVRREFKNGESIFQQGDPGEVIYLIESGQVRIFVHGAVGQELSMIVHGAGDMFGEMSVIDGLPRSASAQATEDTIVYALSRDNFRKHLRRSTQLAMNFMKALSLRVRYSSEMVGNLALLDVATRLARKLFELTQTHGEQHGDGSIRISMALTQSDLASMIGTTRESINKALGNFKRQGLLKQEQGNIVIVNMDALKDINS